MHVERLGPIITPDTHPSAGTNINGPSLIRVPDWVDDPLGRYYLYFADHKGSDIRLAWLTGAGLSLFGRWVDDLADCSDDGRREPAALGVFVDQCRVIGDIDAKRLVARDVAVLPLDVFASACMALRTPLDWAAAPFSASRSAEPISGIARSMT